MAIDKIKLRSLARDKDERLFAEGDMLDARNITVSVEGESTGGIVKNVKSTVPGTAATTADQIPNEAARVIGSVSDHSRGKVYFFVWSTTASNHAIYQYDTSSDTYRVVLKTSVFDFNQYGFVKADLINGDFQKNGSTQTIVYFNDNDNPPRKINIDRAVAGDFNSYTPDELKHAISAIKAPSLFPPTVRLVTDSSRTTNNLYGSVFQFAIQYIYKDGEYSVLSPHSKVVYPKHMSVQGVVSSDSDLQGGFLSENRAIINTRWTDIISDNKEDVSKIRVLARNVNTNPFIVVDEFDPNETLLRNGQGVYYASSGDYNFYNDGLYLLESSAITDKVFDDVPQKAAGQAITGNRMMYSAPNAGYDNVNASATLTVNYESEPTTAFSTNVSDTAYDKGTAHYAGSSPTHGKVKLDMSSIPGAGVSGGTTLSLSISYKPTDFALWGYYNASAGGTSGADNEPLYNLNFDVGGTATPLSVGEATDGLNITSVTDDDALGSLRCQFDYQSMGFKSYNVDIYIEEDTTQADVLSAVASAIENEINTYKFRAAGSDYIAWALRSGSTIAYELRTRKLDFDLAFDAAVDGTNIELTPKMWNFKLPFEDLYGPSDGGLSTFTSSNKNLLLKNPNSSSSLIYEGTLNSFNENAYWESSVGPRKDVHGFPPSAQVEKVFLSYVYDGTPQIEGLELVELLIQQAFARRTFKAGCDHKFGVVYFDEYGRPGYVNELGAVYVKPFGDSARSGNNGPCTISIDITSEPPSWAKTYQIVYADMGSWERFETFVVGGAHLRNVKTQGPDGDETDQYVRNDDKIYLSLNTLTKYQVDKGALKDYVYTPGDKVRVISYRNATTSTTNTYFSEADKYIFDGVGIEVLLNHIDDSVDETSASVGVHTNKRGEFLVVSPPNGQQVSGFDPTGAAGSTNNWDNECLVEILTPRKTTQKLIYYEIGESRKILGNKQLSSPGNNKHNDGNAIEITEGSVYYGTRPVVTPHHYGTNAYWSITNIEDFVFDVRPMESMDASDFIASRAWSKGRAHVKYDAAANMDYPNRIVYSAEFTDPLGNITFNDFNPGSLSFKDLPRNFGAVNYINEYNQNLVAIQENKLSLIPVSRNIIEYADGTSAITANASVLGVHKEANGDFGVGSDPSSVFVRDGMIYFADRSRQKIILAAGQQMMGISDLDMSSFFESEFNSSALATGVGGRVVTGYDPEDNILFITIEPKVDGSTTTYPGTTVGYSVSDKRWISRYDFKPSNYASIDNKMLSGFSYQNAAGTESYLFNDHSGTTRNQLYGTSYPSSVKVVSKISPSESKVFNALSYEGSSSSWFVSDEGISTNLNQNSKGAFNFIEHEGSYYAEFPKVKADNYVHIGVGVSKDGATVTLSSMSRLNRLGVNPIGLIVYYESGGSYTQLSSTPVIQDYNQSDSTITLNIGPTADDFVGQGIYVKIDNDEDSMRGHWAEIELVNNSILPHELYCVNTHITPSKLHHPLGQQ